MYLVLDCRNADPELFADFPGRQVFHIVHEEYLTASRWQPVDSGIERFADVPAVEFLEDIVPVHIIEAVILFDIPYGKLSLVDPGKMLADDAYARIICAAQQETTYVTPPPSRIEAEGFP